MSAEEKMPDWMKSNLWVFVNSSFFLTVIVAFLVFGYGKYTDYLKEQGEQKVRMEKLDLQIATALYEFRIQIKLASSRKELISAIEYLDNVKSLYPDLLARPLKGYVIETLLNVPPGVQRDVINSSLQGLETLMIAKNSYLAQEKNGRDINVQEQKKYILDWLDFEIAKPRGWSIPYYLYYR
ncbi:MAG: hypothetical protein K8F27_08270 [Sulfuricellaceae bacterium]|nr:hypothetical protein [Sulfuricellaceae bacterium]